MPQTEQLFVITASNADAQRHIGKSIANSIDPALCTQHFDSAALEDVREKSADGKFYAWGAVPGKRNQPTWSSMQAGDYVLVYQEGRYTYWTRVISKHRNAAFADAVWRRDPEGRTWEFMYFLQHFLAVQEQILAHEGEIGAWLSELEHALERKDGPAGKRIRERLRKLGHYGGLGNASE